MQGIYNYTSETNNVFRVGLYSFAAILQLQFMAHGMSFLMLNVLYFTSVLSQAIRSAQCVFFFQFPDFMRSRHVAQVFSE